MDNALANSRVQVELQINRKLQNFPEIRCIYDHDHNMRYSNYNFRCPEGSICHYSFRSMWSNDTPNK